MDFYFDFLKNRLLIVLGMIGIIITGIFQYKRLPTDAFRYIPIMVPIFAEAHGMARRKLSALLHFQLNRQ